MDQAAWQELHAFLAQPQDLARVCPGDTLIVHARNYNGPPPDIFYEVSVHRITEENWLIYGHPVKCYLCGCPYIRVTWD